MYSRKTSLATEQIYQNIMEILVREEIEKQLKAYPKNLRQYLNKIEIEAYALNRLPALYASSEQGKEKQKELGQQQYQKQISLAVRRGLAMVEQNPERESRALILFSEIEIKYEEAQKALQQLQQLLIRTQLLDNSSIVINWDNLVTVVKQALIKLYKKENKQNVQLHRTADDRINLGWDSDYIR